MRQLSSKERKAVRLAVSGRVQVMRNETDTVLGVVKGDHSTYRVRIDPDGWWCTCPATVKCSHVLALLVEVNATAQGVK